MRPLLFIDNDSRKMADEDADTVKNLLEACDVPEHVINSMQIIFGFNQIARADAMDMLFSGNYILCTYSMYTTSQYNSLGQIADMLRAAGKNNVKGIVYIDGSGKLLDALDGLLHFDELKGVMALLNAIDTNQIITFKDADPFRIQVCLQGYRESSFKLEAVDLSAIISDNLVKKIGK